MHEKTRQQFMVVARPVRKSDNYWVCTCRLIDNSYDSSIDLSDFEIGDKTRFQSVAMPELHKIFVQIKFT